MEIAIIILIFIMGTLFGSFATLAIYRLPLKKDIVKTRSFCPNCEHKLGFFDLIPVLSYIFLGGKCRYCGKKIDIKYFLIELSSGIMAVIIFLKLQVSTLELDFYTMLDLVYLIIYMTTIIIIGGIDKEKKLIYRPVYIFGTILCFAYMSFLCVSGKFELVNLYRYAIYVAIILILCLINQKKLDSYIMDMIILVIYMQLFIETYEVFITVLITIMITLIRMVGEKTKPVDKSNILMEDEKINIELPMAFYMAIANCMSLLLKVVIIL